MSEANAPPSRSIPPPERPATPGGDDLEFLSMDVPAAPPTDEPALVASPQAEVLTPVVVTESLQGVEPPVDPAPLEASPAGTPTPVPELLDVVQPAPSPESMLAELTGVDGLVMLSEAEAAAYREILTSKLGLTTSARSIRVDRRGWSPDLESELGAGCLSGGPGPGWVVLVSQCQLRAPLMSACYSFERDLLDDLVAASSVQLDAVLARQPLAGQICTSHPICCAADLLEIDEASLTLDTPAGHLAAVADLYSSVAQLREQPDRLLDEHLVDGMVARSRELTQAMDALPPFGLSGPITATIPVGSFSTDAFGGVYRLKGDQPFLVHNPTLTPDLGRPLSAQRALRINEPDLIDRLHREGFLTYDDQLTGQRLREVEDEVLLSSGIDPLGLDPANRRRVVVERLRQLPRSWHELSNVARGRRSGGSVGMLVATLSPEGRIKLSRPARDDRVVAGLLADLDKVDYARLLSTHPVKFAREFHAASPMRRAYLAATVKAPPPAQPPPERIEPEEPEEDQEEIVFLT
ncbi:MAG: hypothetical protein HY815_14785 [Candidatus Riflebacteria bacterium]|nr:hypothetical protein [Candidatus Riflebacteria bacterium]